ncbi:hypothetical protein HZC33_01965, partial [Candidatus Wolfebacteria bacterium]|nr:hypothetical protein [Candidatus Wolfebacteria bacterium]
VDSNGYLYTNVGEKINPADGSVVWSIGKTCGESVIVDNGIFYCPTSTGAVERYNTADGSLVQ